MSEIHYYFPVEPWSLIVGSHLVPAVQKTEEQKKARFIDELLPLLRDGVFYEMGVPVPAVTVHGRHAGDFPNDDFEVEVFEKHVVGGTIPRDCFLVRSNLEQLRENAIDSLEIPHPIYGPGDPIHWIHQRHLPWARRAGLPLWDVAEFFILVLSRVFRDHVELFLNLGAVYHMVEDFRKMHPGFGDDLLRYHVSVPTLADVLKQLVAERYSIRDLDTIFETIIRQGHPDMKPESLANLVKAKLPSLSPSSSPPSPVPHLVVQPRARKKHSVPESHS